MSKQKMSQKDLLLLKLKKEDQILSLQQEVLLLEKEMHQAIVDEELTNIKASIKDLNDQLAGRVYVTKRMVAPIIDQYQILKIREQTLKMGLEQHTACVETSVEEIQANRMVLAQTAQKIISEEKTEEELTPEERELEALLQVIAQIGGVGFRY